MPPGWSWVIVLTVLSGCLADEAKPPATESDLEPTVTTAPSEEGNEPIDLVPALPAEMHWTDCHGVFTVFNWPGPTNPAMDFAPWGERDPSDITDVRMIVMECERFGFGVLERGPTSFVIEAANERQPPESCLAAAGDYKMWTLLGIWASDPEIGASLARESIPVGPADISISTDETAGSAHARADWTIAGQVSYLEAFQEGMSDIAGLGEFPMRFVWQNAIGGISTVDFGYAARGPTYPSERLVEGQLAPPMTMAMAGGPYIAPGLRFSEGDFGGTINRFGSPTCESP